MRSLRRSFKDVSFRKRSQHITITVLVLVLTFSIVLAMPETNTKTILQPTLSEKTAYSNGELLWNQTYGGTKNDYGRCVVQTSDGGYIIVGSTFNEYQWYDVWLIKTDENGNEKWNQTYGGTSMDEGFCVRQTGDGGYIITGYTDSSGAGGDDVWLIKTDENGDHLWNKTYGGTSVDEGFCVRQTGDGGYIVTGYTNSSGAGDGDVWLIKTDENGDHLWNKTYGGSSEEWGSFVEQTDDGGYIITGYTVSSGAGSGDVWLIKTYPDGTEEWNQTYGGTSVDGGFCVRQTGDGGYIITGFTASSGAGGYDVWLIKTNSTGGHEWNQTYGGTLNEEGKSVVQTSDGGYIITGTKGIIVLAYTMSIRNAIPTDVLLIKTDENGNHLWNQTYGGTDYDAGSCVAQTSDGEYIIVGSTQSFGAGWFDVWLLKVASGFPVIDHPADITYEEGSSGHNITWQASDAEPSSYTVTRNETLLESGPWAGGNITVNVDGLAIGVYLYTCTVNDTIGQSTSDTVMVTVTEKGGGFPWGGLFIALALIGLAAAVIIYQTQYAKKP